MALTTIEPFGINSSNSFTFANVTATGNITGNFFIGNGSQLTGLPESYSNANVAAYLPTYTGNISADTITANTFTGNISGGSNTASTVTASAQPNITSVGTLTSVSVSGNIDGGNIAGNGAGLTSITGANVTGTVANATYATSAGSATSATTADTVTTAAQPNITSVGTLTSLSSSGNITGAYFIGNGSQLTGLPESYANANVAAYLPTYTGNLVSLQGNVTTTANISASHVLGNGSGLSSITGANVTGQVANALVSGTVYTAAQPNITSVGTLSSVSVSGNVAAGNIVSDAHVAAATLQTTGNAIIGGDLVVNGNTIQVNIDQLNVQDPIIGLGRGANNAPLTVNDGKDRGTEMWYYTDAEKSAFVGYQNSTGNIIAASNISMANEIVTVNSYGNFVAGNVIGATVSATGNITGNYFVGNGSQLTGLPESYGNANVAAYLPTYTGNLVALTGNVTTTANVTGNYILGNGSQLTGLPETYANANVAAYLPTYTGNLVALTGNVTTTANVSANYLLGNGSQLTGIAAGGGTTTFSSTAPVLPAQGDIWINSTSGIQYIYFNDNTSSQWAEMEAQTSIAPGADLSAINQNIVPSVDVTYDLGSATYRWRDIYLSGNTINLGGATIKTDAASGAIALIPEPTEANPNPSGMVVSPSGGITVVATVGGEVSGNAIGNAAASPTAAPVPIDITTTAPTNGQALIWDSANSEFVPGNVSAGGGGATTTVYANIASLPLANVTTGSMAFVSGNNRLYLWNGTGWFNIALINTNPTITGGADPTYTFATDGTPIVLTLVASDPEGIPLTWSYEVTAGALGNTATISQADNVFTITPSTDSADGGVFGVTFSASDGVNIGTTASSFSLVFSAADPYYKQSVLLSTTDTNNGTNNTFVDSSTNNFAITRNGNTTQGTFSPYSPAGWSGYFDGTGDRLSIATGSAVAFGTGDLSLECWIYPTALSGVTIVFDTRGAGPGFALYTNGATIAVAITGSTNIFSGGPLSLNQWTHLAITRTGTTARLFINGALYSSTTNTTNFGDNATTIGDSSLSTGSQPFYGYISNIRFVKGTALYTTNFTPPTEPLTAVSGTSLLTLQSNRLVDNSANNFAITRTGDTKITPFSPFNPTLPYSTSANGGSAYFDGTGDFLTVPSNAVFQFGTGDFTIECWIYKLNAGNGPIIDARGASTAVPWALYVDANNFPYFYSGTSYTSTVAILNSQWNHVVAVRTSSVLKIFVNGVEGYSASHTVALNPAATVYIGGQNFSSPALMTGYISNLRIVKGTAVYTAAFTPPTAPVTAVANTSLLLNSTNANIYDQTGKVDLETVGDAKTSTSVIKYGTTSMAFDGTGDYLYTVPNPINAFGTADFTLECWVYATSTPSDVGIFESRTNGLTSTADGFTLTALSSSVIRIFSNGVLISSTGTAYVNTWCHVAVVRSSGTLNLYINGVSQGTNSASRNMTNTDMIIGGGRYLGGSAVTTFFPGYISDFRITKGHARYTANFTPPTAQLGYFNPE